MHPASARPCQPACLGGDSGSCREGSEGALSGGTGLSPAEEGEHGRVSQAKGPVGARPQPGAAPGTAALRGQSAQNWNPAAASRSGRRPGVPRRAADSLCLGLPVAAPPALQGRSLAPLKWPPCSWHGPVPRTKATAVNGLPGLGGSGVRGGLEAAGSLGACPVGPGLSTRGAQPAAHPGHRSGGLGARSPRDLLLPPGTGALSKGPPAYPRPLFCCSTE